jgi:cephalosporin hydroxylase
MDDRFKELTDRWIFEASKNRYTYNFTWLGRPIIQFPQDIQIVQELIWSVRPDLIVETGIAHGGSLILSASMLALLDMSEAIEAAKTIDPAQSARKVVGIDIDIRSHNRSAIEAHPMRSRIEMIEGSSTDAKVIKRVQNIAREKRRVLVLLDSLHTHDHVLAELNAYSPLVSLGSYCVVFDTIIESFPSGFFHDRPWDVGNNPKTAVVQFLQSTDNFEVDQEIHERLAITYAPGGFLKRVR